MNVGPKEELLTICHCCPCCCFWKIIPDLDDDISNKIKRLDDVEFHIPENSYMDKWTFTSSDGRFEMEFQPVMDRAACMDFKLIVSDQHQVFGKMSGKATLDDDTVIEIKDVLCFAEKVHNKY